MKEKLLTLMLGVPLVALGVRWLGDGGSAGVWLLAPGVVLFLAGQTLVRFEDFPSGTQILARLVERLK